MTYAPTTVDALRRAVLDRPDDDLPRLIFADALDERGGPGDGELAEFVRVQCRLEEITDRTGAPASEYDALRRREREFIENRGYGWCDGLLGEGWKVAGGVKGQNTVAVRFFKGLQQIDAEVTFRRGFVHSLRVATLADLLGGWCGACHGVDGLSIETGLTSCPDCSGTGRVPDRLADIWGRHPVTAVEVGNKAPSDQPLGWCWWADVGLDDTDTLPAALIDWMAAHTERIGYRDDPMRVAYPTREAALAALSASIVALGRRSAGLRPLTPEE